MAPRYFLRRDRFMAAIMTTVLALAGCGEEEGTGPGLRPASISITPGTLTFASINETHPLTAIVRNATGSPLNGVTLSWRSSDSAVASVSSSGLVTARGNGTAFISARVDDLADSVGLTVQQVPTGLSVGIPQDLDGPAGLPLSLEVTVVDALGSRVLAPSPSVTIGLESNDQGSLLTGPLTSDPVDGTASFENLHITRAGRNFRISAAAGSLAGRSVPFTVELRLGSISVGNAMACGLGGGGDAYCWGRNFTGGLGTGTVGHRSRPTLVTGGLKFLQVDAGSGSNIGGIKDGGGCGIAAGGKAYCWGRNDSGQLGDGNKGMDSNGPVAVRGGIVFTIVQMGRDHTCGVDVVGLAHCWGNNQVGQLGIGTLGSDSDVPVAVATGLRFLVIRVGDTRTCGVSFAGATYCWGEGGHSPLPGVPIVALPTLVGGGAPFVRVDPGTFLHLCGSTAFGQAYCWGQDFAGELGNGAPGVNAATPTPVTGNHIWEFIGASGQYSCGLIQGGTAACWGQDFNGSLGQGTIGIRSSTPRPVVGGLLFNRLAVGHGTSCGTALNDLTYCWGAGLYGERGDGTMDLQMAEPVKVQAP